MLLIYLIISFVMIFQSGMFWSAYRIDQVEGKTSYKLLAICIGMGLFGLYFLIKMIGRANEIC